MTVTNSAECGAYDLSVKLTQGSKSCETGKIEEFSSGDHLKWNTHNNNMGDCSSTEFDLDELFLNFSLITSYGNDYCPATFEVNFERGIYNYEDFDDYATDWHIGDYRISSYKTPGYYFFTGTSTEGIIRTRVLFEG